MYQRFMLDFSLVLLLCREICAVKSEGIINHLVRVPGSLS